MPKRRVCDILFLIPFIIMLHGGRNLMKDILKYICKYQNFNGFISTFRIYTNCTQPILLQKIHNSNLSNILQCNLLHFFSFLIFVLNQESTPLIYVSIVFLICKTHPDSPCAHAIFTLDIRSDGFLQLYTFFQIKINTHHSSFARTEVTRFSITWGLQ